jgi:pimeloyl-ACP methyl ester carboxylesterase
MRRTIACAALALLAACAADIPAAVTRDPAPDAAHPAAMQPIHVPSGGVEINGVIYTAAGAGPHPTFVLFHGLPGNEKNLDLAQAVRRAGWNVAAINYRGSWGSPGAFRFAHTLEDAAATLAYLRNPANAARLGVDPARIAIGGHSMGGWVTAQTIAHDDGLLGAVMISAGDIGRASLLAKADHAAALSFMNDSRESLAATGEEMVDELVAPHADWTLPALAPRLGARKVLVLYSEDFVKGDSVVFVAAAHAAGATGVRDAYVATDHAWSDHRIDLETRVVRWLQSL